MGEKIERKHNERIYEAARRLGLSSHSLVDLLRELGFCGVKSHMSVMTAKMVERLTKHFDQKKREAKKEYEKKEQKKAKRHKRGQGKKLSAKQKRELDRERRHKRHQKILSQIDETKVREAVKRTLAKLKSGERRKKYHRKEEQQVVVGEKVLRVPESLTTADIAEALNVTPAEIIQKCIGLGLMVTQTQRLDFNTMEIIADSYGYKILPVDIFVAEDEEAEPEDELVNRPPIVTIMGHVDHGKTTLLDYIRETNVVAGEKGGITQHIGAYQVDTGIGKITFIDTPGHAAFTAMRARGASVTDIVILIVAANDGVMPQTNEAISHASAAGVPIIVAINKCDLADANPDRVKKELAEKGLLCEEWGGDTLCVDISALTGDGVDELLELILLQAEMMELKANPNRMAKGVVLEAALTKGLGPTATLLVQQGTLRIGNPIVAGGSWGRVRAIYNERRERLKDASPAAAVIVTGLNNVPKAGESFFVVDSEVQARQVAQSRSSLMRDELSKKRKMISLADFQMEIAQQEMDAIRVVLKSDVQGSAEAIADMLLALPSDEVKLEIVHSGVGTINESDVLLASAAKAVIIGFGVKPDGRAREIAKRKGIEIRTYNVIYELQDDIRKAMEGMLTPDIIEEKIGVVEVRQIFHSSRYGDIAGCYVQDGVVRRGAIGKLYRDGELIGQGIINTLKRFRDDVKEVASGYECGLTLENIDIFWEGDRVEVYEKKEIERKLS